jgi:hypothetical protein
MFMRPAAATNQTRGVIAQKLIAMPLGSTCALSQVVSDTQLSPQFSAVMLIIYSLLLTEQRLSIPAYSSSSLLLFSLLLS